VALPGADTAKLADRIASVLPNRDYSEAVEDVLQYGSYFDEA
jgi:hypothetical protein